MINARLVAVIPECGRSDLTASVTVDTARVYKEISGNIFGKPFSLIRHFEITSYFHDLSTSALVQGADLMALNSNSPFAESRSSAALRPIDVPQAALT